MNEKAVKILRGAVKGIFIAAGALAGAAFVNGTWGTMVANSIFGDKVEKKEE